MRLRKLRGNTWAAWFGISALVLNLLVPVHLAFDLADALGHAPHRGAGLLAQLAGHSAPAHEHDRDQGRHRTPECPVCSALGALVGFAPAAVPVLSPPPPAAAPALPLPAQAYAGTFVAAYRSRAPPVV